MCAITGIYNKEQASKLVAKALKVMQNRGKDATNTKQLSETSAIGHNLHAIVGHTEQPIENKANNSILVANCEIYNWKQLNKSLKKPTKNDAKTLINFLDTLKITKKGLKDITKLEQLDGVYAFAYQRDNKIVLARDILGVKPLFYTLSKTSSKQKAAKETSFAFASEKKALIKIGFDEANINELNPRHLLTYNITTSTLTTTKRPFFNITKETKDSLNKIKQTTKQLLNQAIEKRIPNLTNKDKTITKPTAQPHKIALLFSAGVDSTYIALKLKQNKIPFTCYVTAVEDKDKTKEPEDLINAKKAAKLLDLDLKIVKITLKQIPKYLKTIVPLIEDTNVVKTSVALTFYAAAKAAKKDNHKIIFSGLGSEEIFAGYNRHLQTNKENINKECLSGLRKIYERDLYRDDTITMHNNLELRLPFLDKELTEYALKIPSKYKIRYIKQTTSKKNNQKSKEKTNQPNTQKSTITKWILRQVALEEGMPKAFANRKKKAAQYGSRTQHALKKLTTQSNQKTTSEYLSQFYQNKEGKKHNLKLGILTSGGKDSISAALIMHKQNYKLHCLINMQSENEDSYMFQSAGKNIIPLQAKAMNLPLITQTTKGEKETELEDLKQAIKKAKNTYNIDAIVTGALFSSYQRDRIEKICEELNLKIFSPLWHKPQDIHMQELIKNNIKAIICKVAADGLTKDHLNKKIDQNLIKELKKTPMVNVAFEGGEAESLVLDCPLFKTHKIILEKTKKVMDSTHSGELKILKATLVPK